jgi:hypothetical protein
MTRARKDVSAMGLTVLVVLAFLATHEGWGVPLIGGSHRWAAGAILLLGMATCGLGSPARGTMSRFLALLGVSALLLAGVALATGSLTALSLLVAVVVALWAASTLRHSQHLPRKPIAA